MPISRAKKSEQFEALVKDLKNSAGVAFITFNRVTVEEVQKFRRELRAKGMTYTVIKKTLMALAAKETGVGIFSANDLLGSVAIIISQKDVILPAQEIKRAKSESFDKTANASKFTFAGALFEGKFLNATEAEAFANTATREESLAKIVGFLRSGPQKLHTVLQSGFKRNINVLKNADKFAAK